jgi:ATP-binding cassette subfamily F protein 3
MLTVHGLSKRFGDHIVLKDVSFGLLAGERVRLVLALQIARGATCLLLDEPLNHLDIPSRERFEAALEAFEGTVLAVAHDRTFIERFGRAVWQVADGSIQR